MLSLTFFGVVASLLICLASLLIASPDPVYYVSIPGLLLVVGGTLSLSLICFPSKAILNLFKTVLRKFAGGFNKDPIEVIREISFLARAVRADQNYFKQPTLKLETPFLRDAVEIIQRGGVTEERLFGIMQKRAETFSNRYGDDLIMLNTIGRFPLGLGVLGSILELVRIMRDQPALAQALQTGQGFQALFPAISSCLVPLIYGLVFTQFFFIPLRNKMTKLNQSDTIIRQIVTDGAVLLLKKEHPVLVDDHLKSYLLPMERNQLRT